MKNTTTSSYGNNARDGTEVRILLLLITRTPELGVRIRAGVICQLGTRTQPSMRDGASQRTCVIVVLTLPIETCPYIYIPPSIDDTHPDSD
jgi:hypothetical protein